MDMMASVLGAGDEADFFSRLNSAAKICGFEKFLVGLEVQRSDGAIFHHVTSGYPLAWQKCYAERNYVAHDPTVAYCQSHRDPVIWSESIFSAANASAIWEEARSHGIAFGISVPTHEREGRKSMVSLVRDQNWAADSHEFAELMSMAQVLAACAHIAISRLIVPKFKDKTYPTLTSKEKDCLRWVAQGKTSWEIGQIMKISTPTVVFHLKNLMKKLDVVNRAQALTIALRLGLLN